ncbi:MAG: ADP-ribosylation factor-like protein [Promethearchaeota archaeon]
MLRQVTIIINDDIVYQRTYAVGLDNSLFENILPNIKQEAFSRYSGEIGQFDFFKWRISFIAEKSLKLLFIFITGLADDFDRIKLELFKLKKEFLNLFGDVIKNFGRSLIFEVIDPIVDVIHRNLKPKISLVGFSGVGKTTITKLIRSEEIPMTHIPTITGDVSSIKIGNLYFNLWDFAGQEQFSFLWNKFIRESDAVLLITDSSLSGIEKSKFFLELINEEAPYAHSAIIANKQDLPGALNAATIERMLGLKAYSMIAIDPGNKNKMIQIIADILEMNHEVSPLLKPLFERDKMILEAQNSIERGDYDQTVILFEKIGDVCIDIGDDSLGYEFKEKSENLKKALSLRRDTFR